jgi:hypothetical protein
VATNGIEIARRRTDRIGELHASLVAVHTLCAGNDVKQRSQAGDLLARAEHLLRVTGAEFFRPMFCRVATKVKDQAIASDSQVSL